MNRTPEVTAVVLSIGETTTARAIESVQRQTLPVAEIVLVEGVTPFHRALNQGATRVATPFFVQVDADMVLDADCVERLTTCLAANVGLVVGHLRDPLYDRIEAIKLFRTECARRHPFRDSISPDTDFGADIGQAGWATIYALRYGGPCADHWHTFGEHDPVYTPLYTYAKHVVAGRRLRYRRSAAAVRDQLGRLRDTALATTLMAEIALAHGVFSDGDGDLLRPYAEDRDFLRVVEFLARRGAPEERGVATAPRIASFPKSALRRAYRLGIALAATGDADRFEQVLIGLRRRRHPWAWLTRIGLCEGIFAERYDAATLERAWGTLRGFDRDFGLAARAGAMLRHVLRGA
jgi:hypothetical protein